MIHPRIDELLDNVDSRYALVIVAAKRARQINDYHHQLGEGIGFENAPPPLVESRSKNYLTMALEEVAEGAPTHATLHLRNAKLTVKCSPDARWGLSLELHLVLNQP